MTLVTLELPQRIYQKAIRIARATKRPIEQVVVEWIRPPVERTGSAQDAVLTGLESMNTAQLTQIAISTTAPKEMLRLRELLGLQEQRELTEVERREATRLVEEEDLLTLRKAKAIYLLRQRNAMPDDLISLLS
ncbi:hypothetical protein [Candidatus Amarolinea dominans]|uniref:hypothetical protein n=1 Tax=Candidatus Amarolinea dominans TaxID=3140696 RepID=UPI0031359DCD|nr:hypothetical protein [Anaerolineae bacterium]